MGKETGLILIRVNDTKAYGWKTNFLDLGFINGKTDQNMKVISEKECVMAMGFFHSQIVVSMMVVGIMINRMGLVCINARIRPSTKVILRMEIIMEKEEDISLKMVAHTAAVGKITSSRDKDRLYARTAYHIKEHLDKERKMERVNLRRVSIILKGDESETSSLAMTN